MNLQEAISTCLSKYATFDGRATRSEFWWFYLFTTVLGWGAGLVGDASGQGLGDALSAAIALGFALPTFAAGSRRLHDIGRSGWWQMLIFTGIGLIVVMIWWATSTRPGRNSYAAGSMCDGATPDTTLSRPERQL